MATVIPWKLVELLRTNLTQQNIDISAVRLEGSGAAHCLNDAAVPIYVRKVQPVFAKQHCMRGEGRRVSMRSK